MKKTMTIIILLLIGVATSRYVDRGGFVEKEIKRTVSLPRENHKASSIREAASGGQSTANRVAGSPDLSFLNKRFKDIFRNWAVRDIVRQISRRMT